MLVIWVKFYWTQHYSQKFKRNNQCDQFKMCARKSKVKVFCVQHFRYPNNFVTWIDRRWCFLLLYTMDTRLFGLNANRYHEIWNPLDLHRKEIAVTFNVIRHLNTEEKQNEQRKQFVTICRAFSKVNINLNGILNRLLIATICWMIKILINIFFLLFRRILHRDFD